MCYNPSVMSTNQNRKWLSVKEIALFGMLGALVFASRQALAFLPNIHLCGMFTMLFAVVYRKKGLIPLFVFILLEGIFSGFSPWWIPYLYLWPLLWGVTMLLPKSLAEKKFTIVYPLVCGIHGLLYGTLYAPFQALLFHFNFQQTLAWIASGFVWDLVQAAGNFAAGFLILPLAKLLHKLERTPLT